LVTCRWPAVLLRSYKRRIGEWFACSLSMNRSARGLPISTPSLSCTFVGVMFLIPFLTDNLLILTSYFLLILALAYSSKIFNRFCNTLTRIILPLLILLFIMQSLLYPGGEKIICQIWFMSVKQEGVIFASTIGLRLLIVIGSILVFLITTHPKDMIMALEQKGVPSAIGYIVLSTMQIIPHMEMMSKRILDAQNREALKWKEIYG